MKVISKFLISLSASLIAVSPVALSADVESDKKENEGVIAFNQERFEDAEKYFLAELKTANAKNESLVYLSMIFMSKGKTEEAVEYIEQALELEPNTAEEMRLSGDIYCNQAQKSSIFSALKLAKKCIGQYDKALELEPNNIDTLVSAVSFYLGAPSIAGGSSKKGNELLERLSKVSPEDANTYKTQLLEKEGNATAALVLADELTKNGFKSARNQYAIAHYYRDKKLYEKAKPLFENLSAWQKTPKNKWRVNDSVLQLGEIYLIENKDIGKAIDLIEKYKSLNNNPKDLHYFWSTWSLAKAYKALGQQDKYDELVKKIKSENYQENKSFAKEFEAGISST